RGRGGDREVVGAFDDRLRRDLDDTRPPSDAVLGELDDRLAASAGWCESDHRRCRVDQRRGARRHLPRFGAFGVDERSLLELQRALEGCDMASATTDDEDMAG